MSKERYIVEITVRKNNQNSLVLLDQARRLIDLQGRAGIVAKRGQTNERYEENGRLSFGFADRVSAERYQSAVDEYCSPAVTAKLRS